MYICEYCGKEFDNCYSLGGHKVHCKMNPNYFRAEQQLNEARKHISQTFTNEELCCQYCGKVVHNKGCLVLHERHCNQNPNRIPCKGNYGKTAGHTAWNKGLTAEDDERIKKYTSKRHQTYIDGKIKPFEHHTEDTKKLISEKRKKYLQEHPDEHVWKRSSKFVSKPCEYLKQQFRDNNIDFVEEYTPFNDYSFSVDIAWPDKKIGIEVNGNQHYNSDGTLKEYYYNRHQIFEDRGWILYELHYSKCYKLDVKDFFDKEILHIFDKSDC